MFFRVLFLFFKQKTAYEMRISDWSSDVCSSDLKPGSQCVHLLLQCVQSVALEHCISGRRQRNAPPAARLFPVFQIACDGPLPGIEVDEIGRASCRERVCQYV